MNLFTVVFYLPSCEIPKLLAVIATSLRPNDFTDAYKRIFSRRSMNRNSAVSVLVTLVVFNYIKSVIYIIETPHLLLKRGALLKRRSPVKLVEGNAILNNK